MTKRHLVPSSSTRAEIVTEKHTEQEKRLHEQIPELNLHLVWFSYRHACLHMNAV